MHDLDKEDRDETTADSEDFDESDDAAGELDDDAGDVDLEDGDDHDDPDDETSGALKVAEEELSQREQNARSLAIRRAIERRMEKKRLDEDLDYLDLDLED